MIHTLTEPFTVLREEITKRQHGLKQRILQLLQTHGEAARCLLCGRALNPGTYSRENILYIRPPGRPAPENSCTFKIFECCITKSEVFRIVATNESAGEAEGSEARADHERRNMCQACFTNLHSYPRPVFSAASTQQHDALPLSTAIEHFSDSADVRRIIESFERRRMCDILDTFNKKQIRYKIGIIDEQMNISYRNYMDALEMSQYSDADCFRAIYNELFERKEKLLERLEDNRKEPYRESA